MSKLSFLFLALLAATPNASGSVIQLYFTGTCTDCTGTGTGTLTLDPTYTFGNAIGGGNLVEFTYHSNLVPSLDLTQSFIVYNSQVVPVDFTSGPLTLDFFGANPSTGDEFSTTANGNWLLCNGPCADYGTAGTWSTTDPSSVPEPASIALIGIPLLALAARRFRTRA